MEKDDMILAEGVSFSMDCYKTHVNNNVLVVGTAGAGKTRSIVTPNLLQASGSYVVSDPKGNLYRKYGDYLKEKGYRVVKLDFTDPGSSIRYNPFEYIRGENDIIKFANLLVKTDSSHVDPFWDQAANMLCQSLIAYLYERRGFRGATACTLANVIKMAGKLPVSESNVEAEYELDKLMQEHQMIVPNSFAVRLYNRFRIAAGRTTKSILISLYAKMGLWDSAPLQRMMSSDDIDIPSIGWRKTAVFVVVSDTDRSMDALANLFFTQAMNELCYFADHECEGEALPIPVRFIMDDFATNVVIADFPRMISSFRSRNISTMLMLQTESQLKHNYDRDAETIIGNCDTYIYMGGNDVDTAENIAKRCNLPLDRILYMPIDTNWIFRRGTKPINGRNYDLCKDSRYLAVERRRKKKEVPIEKIS